MTLPNARVSRSPPFPSHFGNRRRSGSRRVELVHAAARELGYIPSANARGLAGGRTGALGLLSLDHRPVAQERGRDGDGDLDENFRSFPLYVDEVQRGVEAECWRHGYALMVAGASRSNSDAVLTDIAGRVDGLAIFSGTIGDAELHRVATRLPVVVLSESSPDEDMSRVSVDNAGGMRALVEHFIACMASEICSSSGQFMTQTGARASTLSAMRFAQPRFRCPEGRLRPRSTTGRWRPMWSPNGTCPKPSSVPPTRSRWRSWTPCRMRELTSPVRSL